MYRMIIVTYESYDMMLLNLTDANIDYNYQMMNSILISLPGDLILL